MKILATLNLQNGSVVPMFQAELAPRDPCEVVEILCEQGCHRVTLVDVDAAGGQGQNRDLIANLMRRFHRANAKVCLQVGGGIRSSDQVQFFLDHGASWILVGTVIQRSPTVVEQLLARFRDHLTAGVDARCGEIQSSGWLEPAPLKADSAGQRIRDHGFRRLLFTDIPAGHLAEPDFETARIIAQSAHVPLFMGGSILTREHLLKAMDVPGLQGVALDALQFVEDPDLLGSLNPAPI